MTSLPPTTTCTTAGDGSCRPDEHHHPPTCPTSLSLSRYQKKAGLLLFSLLYIPLFAGAFFGFGPMQLMLEESGAFHSLCEVQDDDEQQVCPEQTARLLTIPFIGQMMSLSSPLLGIVVDRYGPLALMTILGLCGCLGVTMLLMAVTIPHDHLLYAAFVCIGIMASASSIMTVKTGMVFADSDADADTGGGGDDNATKNKDSNMGQRRVISVLNALVDAGSVTYLGLWGIYEAGVSISGVFSIYLVVAVVCFGGVTLFWMLLGNKDAFPTAHEDCSGEEEALKRDSNARRRTMETVTGSALIRQPQDDIDTKHLSSDDALEAHDDTHAKSPNLQSSSSADLKAGAKEQITALPSQDTITFTEDYSNHYLHTNDPCIATAEAETTTSNDSSCYIPVCQRSPKEQLLSLPFIMLVLFFATNLALNQFVLTTARDFLESISNGNDEKAKQYLAIFTLLMPASIVGVPFTDQMVARFGFHAGFQTVCLLAAIHGIIQLACQELNAIQIVGFLVFSFYRCFLFSIVFSYVPTLLSASVVGKGVGVLHMAGGAFSFWNIPLSNWTITTLGGNFFPPNLLYTLLVVPCSVAAYMIGRSIRREQEYFHDASLATATAAQVSSVHEQPQEKHLTPQEQRRDNVVEVSV